MSTQKKCPDCGSAEIEEDPSRGDLCCTECGTIVEKNRIVSEVLYEETSHGKSSAIGTFVPSDSKGSAKFGHAFSMGGGNDSRELTIRKARNAITILCNHLQLNQHCIDTACNFFKLALHRNLTKGRKNAHVHAACVYLTCRTERTEHLLIDISDVLQICCYQLGRTYLKLSQVLCMNMPAADPCLYIMRFAGKLEFGTKTQQVVNTALRLVQRMKRDSIHSGRRPSGLCGAALLIAARLHEFGRSASDIVKIVKVHESTLRKRLIEFGDTPSSALTLDEFMSIDLEQELAPPSFKAARKKDRERLQKLMEEEADTITELQRDIESQLNKGAKRKRNTKAKPTNIETPTRQDDTTRFIHQSTIDSINEIIHEQSVDDPLNFKEDAIKEIGPDMVTMGLASPMEGTPRAVQQPPPALELDMTFDDIDDEELDSYIMSEHESQNKNAIWLQRNAAFLEEQKIKAEKLKKEQEEGKDKKKKRVVRRKPMGPTNSVGESIEKIIQEKNISSKINYDVLKSLNASLKTESTTEDDVIPIQVVQEAKRPRLSSTSSSTSSSAAPSRSARLPHTGRSRKLPKPLGIPAMVDISNKTKIEVVTKKDEAMSEEEADDFYEEEEQERKQEQEQEVNKPLTESDLSDYYEDY